MHHLKKLNLEQKKEVLQVELIPLKEKQLIKILKLIKNKDNLR
jgi:hypothetical protein